MTDIIYHHNKQKRQNSLRHRGDKQDLKQDQKSSGHWVDNFAAENRSGHDVGQETFQLRDQKDQDHPKHNCKLVQL